MLKKIIFIVLLIQCGNVYAKRPQIEFKHLKVKDGLSQSWVRSICQDRYGLMWFGTNNGLNKYDGYNFTVYKNSPADETSLSNNGIESIYEDKIGNLWVGTENGLNLYDRENDRFIYISAFLRRRINGILELKDGRLFLTCSNYGLYLYNPKNDSIISFLPDENDAYSLSSDELNSILMDDNGNIWIGTKDGLNLLDTLNYKFVHFKNDKNDKNSIGDNNIQALYRDSKNRIWVGTLSGLSLLKYNKTAPEKSVFINYKYNPNNAESISDGKIMAIVEDKYGYLWIGSEETGLNFLDLNSFQEDNAVFYNFQNNPVDNTSLSHDNIEALYEDKNGSIWVGTFGDGINMYNKLVKKFTHYKRDANNPNSLNNNFVNALLEDGDYLWIGTDEGLNIFNRKNKTFKNFVNDPLDNKSLGSNGVHAIKRDSSGNIWIGTWGGGLNLFNSKTNTFTRFEHDPNDDTSIGSNNIFAIIEGQNGELWIATMGGGLNLFDYKKRTFKRYMHDDNDENGITTIADDWIRTVYKNSYGEIWLSASRTVDLFDKKTEKFIHFSHDRNDINSISYDGANLFFEDSKKNLWIGTVGGLNVFNREENTFSYYQQEDGLPNNQINGILEDDHGNLWISTNKGISKFVNGINRTENPIFKNYDVSDGLQGNEFRPRSFCKGKDGTIYFGGKNGFNVFHPDSIKENPYKPPVVITKFLLFNKDASIGTEDSPLKKHISVTKEIILSYKHSVFTLEYAALNFLVPERNQYAFKLEGFEEKWNYVGNKREATYTNLAPGKYIFRVKGSNNDGVWNEEGASLKIIVTPPYWKTLWFRISMIMLAIMIAYATYEIRVRSIVEYGHKLEAKVAERTKDLEKFAYIVAHDLKAPLRGINQLAEWTTEDYSKALDKKGRENLKMLGERTKLTNNIIERLLEYSRIVRIEEKTEKIDLNDLLQNAFDSLEPPDNIKIKLENKLPEYIADRRHLTLLFENLLSNAINFMDKPKGLIKVSCVEENSDWKFAISDNGPGIEEKYFEKVFEMFQTLDHKKTYKSTGIGLATAKKIITLYKGKIWIESKKGFGTTFYFTLSKNRNRRISWTKNR